MPNQIAPNVLNWASIIDELTTEQAAALGKLPFVHPHIALMPDAHAGKGSSVGTVIPTKKAVIPAAVGVDIGCGMIVIRTSITEDQLTADGRSLAELRDLLIDVIPMSAGNYNSNLNRFPWTAGRLDALTIAAADKGVDLSHSPKWMQQLGSLGGGNHFIELCVDEENRIWLFLHSGSRGVGNKIAQKHIKIAQTLCDRWHIQLADRDHAYLPQGTPEFDNYLRELHWAQLFALENRNEMMDRFRWAFHRWLGADGAPEELEVERINTHHNYTEQTTIRGENVWLTRKGAIDASAGKRGLIPGSMGTRSYVVTGLGNESALKSAPHGAGRAFSRTEARKRYTLEDLEKAMAGIEYRHGEAWIDEIPAAYKDIDVIMQDADDLVRIDHTLRQLVNVKGT